MNKWLQCFVWINFGLIFLSIFYLGFLQLYPFKYFEVGEGKVVSVVDREMTFIPNIKRLKDGDTVISCWYQNGVKIFIPSLRAFTGTPDEENKPITITLPKELREDNYTYNCNLSVQISPFRTDLYVWKTEPFQIIN